MTAHLEDETWVYSTCRLPKQALEQRLHQGAPRDLTRGTGNHENVAWTWGPTTRQYQATTHPQ